MLLLLFSLYSPNIVKLLVVCLQQSKHLVVLFDANEMLKQLVLAVQLVSNINHLTLEH